MKDGWQASVMPIPVVMKITQIVSDLNQDIGGSNPDLYSRFKLAPPSVHFLFTYILITTNNKNIKYTLKQ